MSAIKATPEVTKLAYIRLKAGDSLQRAARDAGVNVKSLRKALDRYGYDTAFMRETANARAAKNRRIYSDERVKRAAELIKSGHTREDAAAEVGMNYKSLCYRLSKAGIVIPTGALTPSRIRAHYSVYSKSEMSIKEYAESAGINEQTMRNAFARLGLAANAQNAKKARLATRHAGDHADDAIYTAAYKRYLKGVSVVTLSGELHCVPETIYRRWGCLGLNKRLRGKGNKRGPMIPPTYRASAAKARARNEVHADAD